MYQAQITRTNPAGFATLTEVHAEFPTAEVEDPCHGLFLIEIDAQTEAMLLTDGHISFKTGALTITIEMP